MYINGKVKLVMIVTVLAVLGGFVYLVLPEHETKADKLLVAARKAAAEKDWTKADYYYYEATHTDQYKNDKKVNKEAKDTREMYMLTKHGSTTATPAASAPSNSGNMALLTKASLKITEKNIQYVSSLPNKTVDNAKAQSGFKLVLVTVEMENIGAKDSAGVGNFVLTDDQNYVYNQHVSRAYLDDTFSNTKLPPGGKTKGTLSFEIPTDAKIKKIVYTSSDGDFTVTK
jgi:hypothetical protein